MLICLFHLTSPDFDFPDFFRPGYVGVFPNGSLIFLYVYKFVNAFFDLYWIFVDFGRFWTDLGSKMGPKLILNGTRQVNTKQNNASASVCFWMFVAQGPTNNVIEIPHQTLLGQCNKATNGHGGGDGPQGTWIHACSYIHRYVPVCSWLDQGRLHKILFRRQLRGT